MSALTRAREELKSARADKTRALRRIRDASRITARASEHTLIASGVAWGVGALERKGTKVPTVPNVDAKLLWGLGSLAAAYLSKDERTKRIAQSAGDGLIGAWAYAQGKSGGAAVSGYDDSTGAFGEQILGEEEAGEI